MLIISSAQALREEKLRFLSHANALGKRPCYSRSLSIRAEGRRSQRWAQGILRASRQFQAKLGARAMDLRHDLIKMRMADGEDSHV